jgi:hypothetical protein
MHVKECVYLLRKVWCVRSVCTVIELRICNYMLDMYLVDVSYMFDIYVNIAHL